MSKRPATEDAVGALPAKRLFMGSIGGSLPDDGDEEFTPTSSPGSNVDVESTATAATTPRTKFPSDYKTLACNWPGCTKSFNRPARLRDHMNSHTNSRPHKCPYDDCDKDYIEDKHLKQHIKAVHTHDRKYVCQREGCGKTFVTGTRLKRHQLVHEGADRFRCQDCGQSFRKKETLNKHSRKEHQGLRAHACPDPGCSSAFDSKSALNKHREREHGELKFWCGECPPKTREDGTTYRVGFTTDTQLNSHMRQEHQSCLFCEYKSSSRWELETHIEIHHSGKTVEDRKTVQCPHEGCKKKFTKRSNLNVHIRTAHEGFRFVCGELEFSGPGLEEWSNDRGCGDKFSTKVRLEDHIRFIHLGQERPKLSAKPDKDTAIDFIDEISGITNARKQTLICPHCSEGFIRYYDLNEHVSRVHDASKDASEALHLIPEADELNHSGGGVNHADHSTWLEDLPNEEMFATGMEYEPPQHDPWILGGDEAKLFMLADGNSSLDVNIDPALGNF